MLQVASLIEPRIKSGDLRVIYNLLLLLLLKAKSGTHDESISRENRKIGQNYNIVAQA